ncbi:MAG: cation transporter [Actinomycetota bacterium]|nr:cation transporter [Actinomycetota bacterium]
MDIVIETLELRRRAVRLEYITIGWMLIETSAIAAGIAAHSVALTGFGLDSVIELAAAGVVLWQLHEVDDHREHAAHRLIAGSLYALALYIALDSIYTLVGQERPEHSILGIAIAVGALAIMPSLATAKQRLGKQMGNSALVADSSESSLCAYLSGILLLGLGLNAAFGWWWADPVAALGIAGFALREGRAAWRGEDCCA